jgi:hypothetical protein
MASLLAPASIVGLIFGGCCSNVFALEAIVRFVDTGFLFVAEVLVNVASQERAWKWYVGNKPSIYNGGDIPKDLAKWRNRTADNISPIFLHYSGLEPVTDRPLAARVAETSSTHGEMGIHRRTLLQY